MVYFVRNLRGKKEYLSMYHKSKFLRYLGDADNYQPEKLLFLKRKYEGKI